MSCPNANVACLVLSLLGIIVLLFCLYCIIIFTLNKCITLQQECKKTALTKTMIE